MFLKPLQGNFKKPSLGAKLAKRVLWTMKRARFGAAVKIFKANAAEYFGHRKSMCLKEKSNPCSLLPQTLSPYQRGQNAPPEERRFLIPTVAARGRQRFPFQINRSIILFSHFTVGNGLDRSASKESVFSKKGFSNSQPSQRRRWHAAGVTKEGL